MALCSHPIIPSDLEQEQVFESYTGILHETSSDTHITLHYCITTWYILLIFTQYRREAGYDTIYFTPFSLESAWTRLYPESPISNIISVWLNETTPPTSLTLASSISTFPTPETPLAHSSLTNQTVELITALIALVHQSLQQNAEMMAQIHPRPTQL